MKTFEISSGEFEPIDPADRNNKWRPAIGIMALVLTVACIGMFANNGAKQGSVLPTAQRIMTDQDGIDCGFCINAPQPKKCNDQCGAIKQLPLNAQCNACKKVCKEDGLPPDQCVLDCKQMNACPPQQVVADQAGGIDCSVCPNKQCNDQCQAISRLPPNDQCPACKKVCAEDGLPPNACALDCKKLKACPGGQMEIRGDYSTDKCKKFCLENYPSQFDGCLRKCKNDDGPKCEICEKECQDNPRGIRNCCEECARYCKKPCGGKSIEIRGDYPKRACEKFCKDNYPPSQFDDCVARCGSDSGPKCATCKNECARHPPGTKDCCQECAEYCEGPCK